MKQIAKLFALIFLACGLFQCSENLSESPGYHNNKNNALIGGASNSTTKINSVAAESGSYDEITDATGTIHVKTFWAISSVGQINTLTVPVDPAYVVVGGSAGIWGYTTPNALLTESRPDFDNNSWVGSSKDHLQAFLHQLTVEAIGLRIDGITPAQLRSYMLVVTDISNVQSHPSTGGSGFLPYTGQYHIIGGGAKVNWTGEGNLLVSSLPADDTKWIASAKDHIRLSPASITTYTMGIQASLPGYGNVMTSIYSTPGPYYYAPSGPYTLSVAGTQDGGVPTCAGARAEYGGIGRMLYGIKTNASPSGTNGTMYSKDHLYYDNGYNYAYLIKLRKI